MQLISVKTRKMQPPQDDLYAVFDDALPELQNGDVVLVSSKVVSIHQGRCIPVGEVKDKDELIEQEADYFIPRDEVPGKYVMLTIKHNTLIATAGIDESNADGHYILWPEAIQKTTQEIYFYLKKKFGLEKFGVIMTDSHSVPMRAGVLGVGIGFFGIRPVRDYRGTQDLFGRKFAMAQTNIIDSLAATAVYAMGEGIEQTPIVILRGLEDLEFIEEDLWDEFVFSKKEDIYYPLLKGLYANKNS